MQKLKLGTFTNYKKGKHSSGKYLKNVCITQRYLNQSFGLSTELYTNVISCITKKSCNSNLIVVFDAYTRYIVSKTQIS